MLDQIKTGEPNGRWAADSENDFSNMADQLMENKMGTFLLDKHFSKNCKAVGSGAAGKALALPLFFIQ